MTTAIAERVSRTQRTHGKDSRVAASPVPLLDNGYRLSRPEFHRRYELMPEVKKAELVEGVVIMGSPVSVARGEATASLAVWLGTYRAATPGARLAENTTLVLDTENEFQPDLTLRLEESCGGLSQVVARYLHGLPELVAEVAVSSVAQDLHGKFDVYRRVGIPEYLVWQIEQRRIDWYVLQEGEDIPMKPTPRGVLRRRVFPGLWLAPTPMPEDNLKKVLSELHKGRVSSEHGEFVRKSSAR